MKKPVKVTHAPHWDYSSCIKYIEDKYKIKTRDYAGKFLQKSDREVDETPYLDFWHWVISEYDWIKNECYISFEVKKHLEDEKTEQWVKEILTMLYKEFEEDEMRFWIEW
jgi:hypothetical protein